MWVRKLWDRPQAPFLVGVSYLNSLPCGRLVSFLGRTCWWWRWSWSKYQQIISTPLIYQMTTAPKLWLDYILINWSFSILAFWRCQEKADRQTTFVLHWSEVWLYHWLKWLWDVLHDKDVLICQWTLKLAKGKGNIISNGLISFFIVHYIKTGIYRFQNKNWELHSCMEKQFFFPCSRWSSFRETVWWSL